MATATQSSEVQEQVNGEGKPKWKRPERLVWRAEDRDEKGNLKTKIKGKDIGDWNAYKYMPLAKKDFENEADFFDFRADQLTGQAERMRKKATDVRQFGSAEDRKKALQLKRLHDKFATLEAEFKAAGMTDDQLANFLKD